MEHDDLYEDVEGPEIVGNCRNCKKPTHQIGPFGEPLCEPCWDAEDDAIAHYSV